MRILFADDHALIRDGFRPFLQQLDADVEVVEAGDLDQAIRSAEETDSLDLVILDLNMPGMNGLDGVGVMREKAPDVPVAILTGSMAREDVLAADQAGAAGYLLKTMSGKALVNALRLILSGGKYLPPEILTAAPAPEPEDKATSVGSGPMALLTDRERQVLALLAEGNTNKEIARELDLQEITVKIHLKKIFRKLNVSNRTKAARIALEFLPQAGKG